MFRVSLPHVPAVDEADVQWDFDAVLNELMVEANPANEDSEEEGEEAMDKTILSMKNKQDELPQELSSQSASSSTAAASARPFSSAPTAPDKDSSSASSGNAPPVPARTGRRAARQE
jgi:hypothetical protein